MNQVADKVVVGAISLQAAIELVWKETDQLDRNAYRDWLRLWTPGGLYIIPIDRDPGTDFRDALNVAYDDAEMREARVRRLLSGFAMSAAPPARTVRLASRFVVLNSDAGAIELRCAQVLTEYKYGRTRVLAADVDYRLVAGDEGLLIDRKVVRLINSDEPLFGIGYLL